MENTLQQTQQAPLVMTRTFLASVFSWMSAALALTAITAYIFGTDETYIRYLVSETGLTGAGYFVMFAPLGFVLLMSFGFQRLSQMALTILYLVYSVITGMSLSFIFYVYAQSEIFMTFGITAGLFGVMALTGYTTKTDLTKLGSLLFMGLIGIIIASIVNWFVGSSQVDYIISFIGVIVFTGLTAYDVQKLKRIGAGIEYGTEATAKLSIMGALNLYLDFINLFLMLLRLFGNRK
jgi:FtsH-binding integral membrane protein